MKKYLYTHMPIATAYRLCANTKKQSWKSNCSNNNNNNSSTTKFLKIWNDHTD